VRVQDEEPGSVLLVRPDVVEVLLVDEQPDGRPALVVQHQLGVVGEVEEEPVVFGALPQHHPLVGVEALQRDHQTTAFEL
jgi:hypothetical protein